MPRSWKEGEMMEYRVYYFFHKGTSRGTGQCDVVINSNPQNLEERIEELIRGKSKNYIKVRYFHELLEKHKREV